MNITNQISGSVRGDCGAWAPCEFFDIDGVRIAVSRRGEGIPVVCLHAVAHGARDFEPLAERLAGGCQLLAIDWPGHGRSASSLSPASSAYYADVLIKLLPQLTNEPAVLLGCSIGGAAALQTAARRPDLVRALVLCNSGGLLAVDPFVRTATRLLSRFFAAGARRAAWFPRAFALYYRMVLQAPPAHAQRQRIVDAAYETAEILTQAWSSFGEPSADLRPLIPSIRQPTLFAWAKSDQILPWWRHRKIAATFPNHQISLFRGGHAAFLEDPDAFATRFTEFLRSLQA